VAGDLNDRGVPTVTGKKWSAAVLRQVLVSGRISGRREYHGQIMTGQASWPAIISAADSDQLRAQLARRAGTPRGRGRSYLMSGIFTCGTCHVGLYGRPHTSGLRYVCVKTPGLPDCGTIAVMATPAEQVAFDVILTALDSPDFLAALIANASAGEDADTAGISGQLRTIGTRRDELAEAWAAGDITRKEWLTARDKLTADAGALTARLSRTQHARTLAAFAAMTGTPWQRWETMTTGAHRALIQATTAAIPIHPATTRRWNPPASETPSGAPNYPTTERPACAAHQPGRWPPPTAPDPSPWKARPAAQATRPPPPPSAGATRHATGPLPPRHPGNAPSGHRLAPHITHLPRSAPTWPQWPTHLPQPAGGPVPHRI